jgi:excisionase family DNA binding protein
MEHSGEAAEAYRLYEQRLRLLLLGDGVSEVGVVKGEEARRRVTTALRHMREAFAEALEKNARRAEAAQSRVSELQEELLRLASQATQSRPEEGAALLTPTEVAQQLDVSVDHVYRAVKRNEIASLRSAHNRHGGIRIPAGEVNRLRASRR